MGLRRRSGTATNIEVDQNRGHQRVRDGKDPQDYQEEVPAHEKPPMFFSVPAVSECKKKLAGNPSWLPSLDLTQIFDDCFYALLDDGFGIARKVYQRVKRVGRRLLDLS